MTYPPIQSIRPASDLNQGTIFMADIIAFKKKTPAQKHKGRSLCRSGFHKWKVVTERKFDVKQGELVTAYKCTRCGKQKNTAL